MENLFSTLIPEQAVRALGFTLAHSIWQGTTVALAAAGGFFLLRRSAASKHYLLGISLLFLQLLVSVATFLWYLDKPLPKTPASLTHNEMGYLQSLAAKAISAPTLRDRTQDWLTTHADELVICWLAGLLFLTLRMAGGVIQLHAIKKKSAIVKDSHWQNRIKDLARELGIRDRMILLESPKINVPLVIGFLRPAVFIPIGLLTHLTTAQLEMVLAHELAHVRRGDFLANWIQTIIDTLFFYHPAIWWLSRRVREERENCCDDIAVSVGNDRLSLVHALVRLAEKADYPILAVAFSPKKKLLARVQRLITPTNTRPSAAVPFIALVLSGLMGMSGYAVAIGKEVALARENNVKSETKENEDQAKKAIANAAISKSGNPISKWNSEKHLESPAKTLSNNSLKTKTPGKILPKKNVSQFTIPVSAQVYLTDTLGKSDVKIVIKGKEYQSIKEMPADVRRDFINLYAEENQYPKGFGYDGDSTLRKLFNSPQWKQQEEEIRQTDESTREFFESPKWQNQQNLIEENSKRIKEFHNSKEWKENQKNIQKNAKKIQETFQSEAWASQLNEVKKNLNTTKKQFDWSSREYSQNFKKDFDRLSKDIFESQAWKKQQEAIRENAEKLKALYSSPEWTARQEEIVKNSEKIGKLYNSPSWKKQQKLIEKNAKDLKKFFESDDWKKQQETIHKRDESLEKIYNSDDWKKLWEEIKTSPKLLNQFYNSSEWKRLTDIIGNNHGPFSNEFEYNQNFKFDYNQNFNQNNDKKRPPAPKIIPPSSPDAIVSPIKAQPLPQPKQAPGLPEKENVPQAVPQHNPLPSKPAEAPVGA